MLGSALFLPACEIREADEPAPVENAAETSLNLPAVPMPEPPLDRAMLLAAVAAAASAAATGTDDAEAQRALAGKPFELKIRFGCRGPAPNLAESVFGWTMNRNNESFRVRATPTISGSDALLQRIAGEEFESAEGFWIPRPWLLEPMCPAAAAVRPAPPEQAEEGEPADGEAGDAGRRGSAARDGQDSPAQPAAIADEQETRSPPPAWPKVGIIQYFSETDARTRQRGMRPYELVKPIDPQQPLPTQGFNLVISGRLRPLPGHGVIECVARGADNPPDCIISARIDRVRLERPENGEVLAQWGTV